MKRIWLASLFSLCTQMLCAEQDYQYLDQLYTNIKGFGISNAEKDIVKAAGGAPTYGEILPKSVSTILDDLNLTDNDVFYDLGSGVGKVAVQVYLESPAKKSVGVELSPTRHAHAVTVYQKLAKDNKLQPNKALIFLKENILDTNISDATVIFMCSTCYSDELMDGLANKIKKLKPGTRVLTLKDFKDDPCLDLIKTYKLPMTWSEKTNVHLYEVVRENEKPVSLGKLYRHIKGFVIADAEGDEIKATGGVSTYGEILPKSVSVLLNDLKLTKDDVFYDLGSGVGKVAVQVYFESPVKKSVGIELSSTRHNYAMSVYDVLKEKKKLQKGRDLVFLKEDLAKADFKDATVVFMASTCFSKEFMDGLLRKIKTLKSGARVLTFKSFKDATGLKFIKTYKLPMSWSKSSTVHLYEVE